MAIDPDEEAENSRSVTGPSFPVEIIASLLELTVRRVQQLAAEGVIPKAVHGKYSLAGCVRGYVRYLKGQIGENRRGTETSRLARAQAIKVEMQNWEAMGELGLWAQIDETMDGLVHKMKTLHEALPGRVSNEFSAITEPSRIYQRLREECGAIQHACADYLEERAASLDALPQPREDAAASEAGDAGGVGTA